MFPVAGAGNEVFLPATNGDPQGDADGGSIGRSSNMWSKRPAKPAIEQLHFSSPGATRRRSRIISTLRVTNSMTRWPKRGKDEVLSRLKSQQPEAGEISFHAPARSLWGSAMRSGARAI